MFRAFEKQEHANGACWIKDNDRIAFGDLAGRNPPVSR
jgi:hypothetical protein